MKWQDEALAELQKAPAFVRNMAKRAVEKQVKSDGRDLVTVDDVRRGRDRHIKFIEDAPDAPKKTKIAIVRCDIVSEVCPGVACMQSFNRRHAHFESYGPDTEIIGVFTCGGCPGRRVVRLVEKLADHGLDAVHLSSCMMLDEDYPKCPHLHQIKRAVEARGMKVIEGTHH
ncbi:MAG: CGGC domain-containing protein [Solirubrobacterales bacterium]